MLNSSLAEQRVCKKIIEQTYFVFINRWIILKLSCCQNLRHLNVCLGPGNLGLGQANVKVLLR